MSRFDRVLMVLGWTGWGVTVVVGTLHWVLWEQFPLW